jgi:putative transposase
MDKKILVFKKAAHKVGVSAWHLVFATKYRYKMFGKTKQRNIMGACLRKMCVRHKIKVLELNVQPDHAHLLVQIPHGMSQSRALQLLKGGSAYYFFKNHPKSRLRYPRGHLWSAGGCAITVGYHDMDTVVRYIQNQDLAAASA